MTTKDAGPLEGYLHVAPAVTVDGDTARIDANGVYYRELNEAIRAALAAGAKTVEIANVNGQRYIGTGVKGADRRIEVEGTPDSSHLLLPDEWPDGVYPLRKDFHGLAKTAPVQVP